MKKVIVLAYFYPPCGGAGVQRTVKFIKYLPDFGFYPIVIAGTGEDSHFHEDQALAKEVAGIRDYNIQFSPFEGRCHSFFSGVIGRWTRSTLRAWVEAASRMVEIAIKKEKPDILFVTTSPFQAAKVIVPLSKKYSIPWVLDMRDPWALDPISHYPTILHYHLELIDMKKACDEASATIMNTPAALNAAISMSGNEKTSSKFNCITNGWDKEDFLMKEVPASNPGKQLRIVHTGVFHTSSAQKLANKLTPMAMLRYSLSEVNLSTRTPKYLFAAYRKLIDESRIHPESIQFVFAGAATPEDLALAQKYQIESFVQFRGYLNHDQSVALLNESDVLFLPLHELNGSRDPLIIPGKTYEYLAARKPILACVPKGDAHDILIQSGLGYICGPSNIGQIAETLHYLWEQHNSLKGIPVCPNDDFINRFERRQLTGNLSDVFESVLAGN